MVMALHPKSGQHYVHVIPNEWGSFVDYYAGYVQLASTIQWISTITPTEYPKTLAANSNNPAVMFVLWTPLPAPRPRRCLVVALFFEAIADQPEDMLPEHQHFWEQFGERAPDYDGILVHTPRLVEPLSRGMSLPTFVFPAGWSPEVMGWPRPKHPHRKLVYWGSDIGRRSILIPYLKDQFRADLCDATGLFGRGLLGALDTAAAALYVAHSDVWTFSTWRLWQGLATNTPHLAEVGDSWPFIAGEHYVPIPKLVTDVLDRNEATLRQIHEGYENANHLRRIALAAHEDLAEKFTLIRCLEDYLVPAGIRLKELVATDRTRKPMSKIPLFKVLMSEAAKQNALKVLGSGYIAQGPQVDEFEAQLGRVFGVDPETQAVITVNSGTTAIDLALALIGVGGGDEILTTPMTCSASNSGIVHRGATIVWADVDSVTGLINPEDVAWKTTTRTKAIVAVDWQGLLCDYERLTQIANGIPIIQDAAHAFAASTETGQLIAQSGATYICFSFQAIKFLNTIDGGAIIVPKQQELRAKKLRWFGLDRTQGESFRCSQDIEEVGHKWHMNDVAAAIGLGNLPAALDAIEVNRRHAAYYHQRLTPLIGSRLLAIPPLSANASWWIYTILVNDRADFTAYLSDHAITTSQVHRRNDEHTGFRAVAKPQPSPLTGLDHFAAHQTAIPCGAWLSEKDVEYIADVVIAWATTK